MLPIVLGAAAVGLFIASQQKEPQNQIVIDLDAHLPKEEALRVVESIRTATAADAGKLDAMAASFYQRGFQLTSFALRNRAWDARGRQGQRPQLTDAPPPRSSPQTRTASPCLDAAAEPHTCSAVMGALATETNGEKLHAFAESLRSKFPAAAGALDAKARELGWGNGVSRVEAPPQATQDHPHAPTNGHANGHSHAVHASELMQVAPSMSNVPPQYHGALISLVQQLGRDASMTPGSDRQVTVGDRVFVLAKPVPGPGVPSGTVWVTRMSGGTSSAMTGYGSGPLWPSDIVDGRQPNPDGRRYMGSPTIMDPGAVSVLSPPAPVPTVLVPLQVTGDPMGAAAALQSMPMGAAFGDGGLPGIMGASRPEIVSGGDPQAQAQYEAEQAQAQADYAAAVHQQVVEQQVIHDQAMHELALQDPMAAQVVAMTQQQQVEAEAAQQAAVEQQALDRRAPRRPRPSWYVRMRPKDSVWPEKLAKIGSGNKRSYDHLVALNPHLVSQAGHWPQFMANDEVNIPPEWADNLRNKGFLVKADPGA
jgi:hypothetical protein